MRFYFPPQVNTILRPGSRLTRWSISKFLILLGAVLMMFVLSISFFAVYKAASSYLREAFSRNAQMRTLAQANAVSAMLDDAQRELEYLSRSALSADEMRAYFNRKSAQERNRYCEAGFQGTAAGEHFVLVNSGELFVPVPPGQMLAGSGDGVFAHANKAAPSTAAPEVHVGDPVETVYAALPVPNGVRNIFMHVIRLTQPVFTDEGEYQGQLVLSINLQEMRNILSLYASAQSPLYLSPQNIERKQSFVFDLGGWLLFESEEVQTPHKALSVDRLRAGLQGDVGRPGFKEAFRPAYEYKTYWTLVIDVQAGQAGQLLTSGEFMLPRSEEQTLFLSYAPIVFHGNGINKIIGGIGCFDSSAVLVQLNNKIAKTLYFLFFLSGILFVIALFFIGRHITRQVENISKEIEEKIQSDDQRPFAYYSSYAELDQFQRTINILLHQLYIARRDLAQKSLSDEDERLRQKISLEKKIESSEELNEELLLNPLHGIVGGSYAIAQLRQQIHKAAGVLADVLIIGETGTGKELTAGAIHALSYRAKGPFISISCGALDENLLMDALFGHVKGAHSEAQSDRKGAFLAASGGTLLLDEIGNASVRVQQALLRALSVRRIIPLGSDQEVAFDARIIAATNVDLLQTGEEHFFREDLYYRLAVITINTPPLRHRKEDIPVLIRFFLERHFRQSQNAVVSVSRGAYEKMLQHDWPGNVRELEHCLTRSLAFVDGDTLLAEHILFNEPVFEGASTTPLQEERTGSRSGSATAGREHAASSSGQETGPDSAEQNVEGLNERQQTVWPLIVLQGSISRGEYQEALEDSISVRTAQYDLYDFVSRGLLIKSGRGPSCRYTLIE
ncbi:MAG: sigma 54-interacting transcriptional regulator [bacterium]|nr:sigma 54-interacting transcriptional regulator [bacterium]